MAVPATERFRAAAADQGLEIDVEVFPKDTRTAEQAAEAIGCELGQIVKSLVFSARSLDPETEGEADELVLVLTSGSNRVDEKRAAAAFGVASLGRADADACRATTGFAIGGIPPCGHRNKLRAIVDPDLLQYDRVWAAAGAPDAVFELTPPDLVRVTGAVVAAIAKRS